MAVEMREIERFVISTILQTDRRSVDRNRIQSGTLWAFNRVIRETKCNAVQTSVTIADTANTVNLETELTKFASADQFINARIGTDPVRVTDYDHLLQLQDETTTGTGQPRRIAFNGNGSLGHLHPKADAEYTMVVTHTPFIDFEIGTDAAISIDFPQTWVWDVVKLGVGAFCTEGQADSVSRSLHARFDQLVATIKGKTAHAGEGRRDRIRDRYRTY